MHRYLAKWSVKFISISAVIVLVTAANARTAIAPPSVPEAIALEAPAPDLASSLVSFTVQTPTEQPAPTSDSATLTPAPTIIKEPGIPTPVHMESPEPQPQAARLRLTPMPIFASVIATPTDASIPEPSRSAAHVPILMYHYISDPPPGSDRLRYSLSVSPSNLDAQLTFLQQAGYRTITLDDLYNHLTQSAPLPDKPVILTFDDGYADAFTFAMPILQKHGFVGTFFVLTGPADRNGEGDYLNWAQITAMSQAGMDMELHSREHVDLRNRPNDFLVHQIAGGRDSLQARTGRPVRWFAYPSGRYDDAVVRMLQSAGFIGAVTTINGRTQTASALFDLQRIRIGGPGTLELFIKALASNP